MLPIIKKTLTNFLLFFFSSFLFSESKDISIVIHGGAGWFSSMTEEEISFVEEAGPGGTLPPQGPPPGIAQMLQGMGG